MNWIVVRSQADWPCAVVWAEHSFDDANEGEKQIEKIIRGCDSVDAVHAALEDNDIDFEPVDHVATARAEDT
jgi:hypothetical protein